MNDELWQKTLLIQPTIPSENSFAIDNVSKMQIRKSQIPKEEKEQNRPYVSVLSEPEMIKRIEREHGKVYHARTHEKLVGCTQERPKVRIDKNAKHLRAFPRLAYHRVVNRQQIQGKFVVTKTEQGLPTETTKLQYKLKGTLKFKNTGQYRTAYPDRLPYPTKRKIVGYGFV